MKCESGKSARGCKWVLPEYESDNVDRLCSYFQIPSFVANVIANRLDSDNLMSDASDFLDPKIKNLMTDPYEMKDMQLGVGLVGDAIDSNKKVAIFGDYDVDGACCCALLYSFLQQCGLQKERIIVYVPDRARDGYGPNKNAMQKLKDDGAQVIISVDCGIVAFDAIDYAKKLGCDFIVLDHHKSDTKLPPADAVINPNRFDEDKLQYLCGAGVVFMFCVALAKRWGKLELKEFLMNSLDLVAIATVCDVVPLVDLNRAFVRQGLKVIRTKPREGIKVLISKSGIDSDIDISAKHIGFNIGPLINACGRIGDSRIGFKILTALNKKVAEEYADKMLDWNRKRVELERDIADKVVREIDTKIQQQNKVNDILFYYDERWHEGVIGIVASRIQKRYDRLAIVGSIVNGEDGKQYIKASCRSIVEVDIGRIVLEAVNANIVLKGGGHRAAAGFTVPLQNVGELESLLLERHGSMMKDVDSVRTQVADCVITLDSINNELLKNLSLLEPFGCGNESVVFLIKNAILCKSKIVSLEHVRLTFKCPNSNVFVNGICFRCVNTPLGDVLLHGIGNSMDLICNIEPNCWMGNITPSMILLDVVSS